KWSQAAEAFDRSEEVEEFQAVGMRCREALLALGKMLRLLADPDEKLDTLRKGDFVGWATLAIQQLAQGASAEEVRGYLTTQAKAAWQLVNWLTHSSSARQTDADLAVEVTHHVLDRLTSLVTKGRAQPFQCPDCGSLAFETLYDIAGQLTSFQCASCGWGGNFQAPTEEGRPLLKRRRSSLQASDAS